MNRRLFGAIGVIGVIGVLTLSVGSCKNDPLSDLGDGTPAALVTDFTFLEVIIGDTLTVTATVVDGRATPIVANITFRTCNAVAATAIDPSYHPVPATSTRAIVTGVTYGTSCLIVEGGGFTDTVQIATFPASIVITGPDTITSGDSAAFTFQFRDAAGAPVAGVPAPTWTSGDTLRGKITAAGGVLTGRDSASVTISVTGTGSPAGGVVGTKTVYIKPAPFSLTIVPNPADPGQVVTLHRAPTGPIFDANTSIRFGASVQAIVAGSLTADSLKVAIPDLAAGGALSVGAARLGAAEITQSPGAFTVNTPATLAGSVSPSSGVPGTAVTISRTSGPVFDANTRVYFNGVRTFVSSVTASAIATVVPGVGAAGAVELRLTRLDAADFARRLTFTADTGVFLLADQYDAVNNVAATAPLISANGDFFVVLSGGCVNGAGGGGTDCDDYFRIRNTGGAAATVTVNGAWLAGPDIDLYGLNPAQTFCTFDGGCAAATGANPEQFSMTIPAGQTWFIYANLWAPAGTTHTVVRIRVTGLP